MAESATKHLLVANARKILRNTARRAQAGPDLFRRPGRAPGLLPAGVRRVAQVARRTHVRRPRRLVPVPARADQQPGWHRGRHFARLGCSAESPRGSASHCRRPPSSSSSHTASASTATSWTPTGCAGSRSSPSPWSRSPSGRWPKHWRPTVRERRSPS